MVQEMVKSGPRQNTWSSTSSETSETQRDSPSVSEFFGDPESWRPRIERALSGQDLSMVVQPLVDLQHGEIVGYEALARFDAQSSGSPVMWFTMAEQLGLGARLEARALEVALAKRAELPRKCFLAVNVSPAHLTSEPVQEVIGAAGDLERVVVELTEHSTIERPAELHQAIQALRRAGASVALDDAGAGYAGLSMLLRVAPDFVKLDRDLITGIERDEVKVALVKIMQAFAGHLDAWLMAEGISAPGELDTLVGLGVPLGQGFLLGRPQHEWGQLEEELRQRILGQAWAVNDLEMVRGLVETVPTISNDTSPDHRLRFFAEHPDVGTAVLVDETHRPIGQIDRDSPNTAREIGPHSRAESTELITDVLAKAVARPADRRWEPIGCTNSRGQYLGSLSMERMVRRLIMTASKERSPLASKDR